MARISRLEASFEPADSFIGIATTMPVVQLVHFINSLTFLDLKREDDFPSYSEKSGLQHFKFFYCVNDDYRSEFCLFANNSSGITLLPSHKQFSFFLVIFGAIPDEFASQLVSRVKSIAGVQLSAFIKQETVKGIGPVLQDLELHLTDLKMKKNEALNRIMPLSEDQ